jgi:hypothetical protein
MDAIRSPPAIKNNGDRDQGRNHAQQFRRRWSQLTGEFSCPILCWFFAHFLQRTPTEAPQIKLHLEM